MYASKTVNTMDLNYSLNNSMEETIKQHFKSMTFVALFGISEAIDPTAEETV